MRGDGHTLYVRVADSHPQDGWGGWLARVRLELLMVSDAAALAAALAGGVIRRRLGP